MHACSLWGTTLLQAHKNRRYEGRNDKTYQVFLKRPGRPKKALLQRWGMSHMRMDWLRSLRNYLRDFPGSPVVKTPRSQSRRHKFNSWLGNQDLVSATLKLVIQYCWLWSLCCALDLHNLFTICKFIPINNISPTHPPPPGRGPQHSTLCS